MKKIERFPEWKAKIKIFIFYHLTQDLFPASFFLYYPVFRHIKIVSNNQNNKERNQKNEKRKNAAFN